MLSARFVAAGILRELRWLEIAGWAFIRDDALLQQAPTYERPDEYDELLDYMARQIARCGQDLKDLRRPVEEAVRELHAATIALGELRLSDPVIQRQCELVLRLPIPRCPPPPMNVDTQAAVIAWQETMRNATESDLELEYFVVVDRLLAMVGLSSRS